MWALLVWAAVAAVVGEGEASTSLPAYASENWRTLQVAEGRDHSCVTMSTPRRLGNTEYQIMLSFGDRNAIALRSSRPIAPSKAVLRTGRNTHSLINLETRREQGKYLVDNRLSRSMFRLVLAELRSSPQAALHINGTDYPLPMADFQSAVGGMMACSRSLTGGRWGR